MKQVKRTIGALFLIASPCAFAGFYFEGNPRLDGADSSHFASSSSRCSADAIQTSAEAIARQKWAHDCGLVDMNKWSKRYKYKMDSVTMQAVERAKEAYPIFVYNKKDEFPIYIPSADCSKFPRDGSVIFYAICEAGCYAGNQLVAFSSGDELIGSLDPSKRYELVTLAKDASLENITLAHTPLSRYLASVSPDLESMVAFTTESGNSLYVTDNHPILTSAGKMKPAREFKPGEAFVKANGDLDKITSMQLKKQKLKVYNVEPSGLDPKQNVVITQGILNGSQNFQDETIKDLDFLVKRETVPADLFE